MSSVFPADVQQTLLIRVHAPEGGRPNMDQQDPQPLHIKKEQEELWTRLEGEQLSVKEETDATEFSFTAVTVKSEDDEEKPLFSQLHQHQMDHRDVPNSSSADQMKVEADGEDCGGAETSRNPDLQTHKDHSSSSETELSEDYEEDQDVDDQHNNTVKITGESCRNVQTGDKQFFCDVCGQIFRYKSSVTTHMRIHTGEKTFPCDKCGQRFKHKSSVTSHMRIHTGEKPFPCDKCGQRFKHKSSVTSHMRIH
ncbi:zinc finger protein 626, partial [Austrofundulus limnaeus]|uniref:Zinc finger protein 626 n=1 Tax=Austrofundulus limnaeus TaxID=52670 RepID=A0A2I4CIS0_AUSLI